MALSTGTAFGSYEIVGLLGRGGMGEVYRARDPRLRRDVAIKVLPSAFAVDPDRLRRFEREAQVLASLNHPNIATLYAIEERDGLTALVLELVEGDTLDTRLTARAPSAPNGARGFSRAKGLPLAEALDIARQICDGLDAAHERGIVHRDLKPGNIKLAPDGVVKLLDFGLAKARSDEASGVTQAPTEIADTVAGVVLGTAAYMSPEQARGRWVDKRTDIWSFGCVLYEMLTGRQVFFGETMSDSIAAILEQEPDWTLLPETAPPNVRRIVQRCLEKDPKRRMRDIADARAELLHTTPSAARPTIAAPERLVWPWIGGVAAGALIAFTVGFALGSRAVPEGSPENPLAGATFTKLTDFDGAEHDGAISPDGKFVAFRSDRDGPFDVWLGQVGSGRYVNLTRGTDDERRARTGSVGFTATGADIWLGGAVDRRFRLMPLLGGTPRVFLGEGVVKAEWSADGTQVAYHTNEKGIDPMYVADADGANPRRIFAGPYTGWHNHFPAWSRDARWIYFVSGVFAANEMDLWRIAAKGGTPERLTYHNSDVTYPTSISDRAVLYVARDRDGSGPRLWAFDVQQKVSHRVSFGLEQYTSVAATTDGRRIVATVANPSSSLWSVPILDRPADEQDARPYAVPTLNPSAPRFGASSLFYLSSGGGANGLWRLQGGEALEIWRGTNGALLEPPAVSPDGKRVGIVLRRSGKLRLHIRSADGAELQPLADAIDVQGTGSWSPDGKWIVTGARDTTGEGLFSIPVDGGPPRRLVAGPALNPVWSPDGAVIVYAGPEVAGFTPLLAVNPDGTPLAMPAIRVRAGDGERARFLPDRRALVYMQGSLPPQDFWLLDFATMKPRQLTRLTGQSAMRTFDITPDGKRIVFDRLRENSDIVLIDLPRGSR